MPVHPRRGKSANNWYMRRVNQNNLNEHESTTIKHSVGISTISTGHAKVIESRTEKGVKKHFRAESSVVGEDDHVVGE